MKKLGKTYIETVVEVPTKFLKGKQYYKPLRSWTNIPHEVIDPVIIRKLEAQVEFSDSFVEVQVEGPERVGCTPRLYTIRATVETHIFVGDIKPPKE